MKYLSVCSGIEAATCAWPTWTPVAFSEIEPFPSAVLAHHYPETPNWGDMTKFKEWPDADVDVLVGGTPCQSFSVAGLRKGLADPRGNLMLTYLAIADRYRPTWLVWENVPGVLSSNGGRDFGTFLGGLGELGYGFAYRVLDAQYFGVAQRRRRVFVVGCLGDWRRAAAVLFERHSLQGHPAPSRKAEQNITCGTARSVAIRGRDGTPQAELGDDCANTILTPNGGRGGVGVGAVLAGVAHSLRAQAQAQASHRADTETYVPVPHADISPAIKARDSKGVSSDGDGDGAILVPMVVGTLATNSGPKGHDAGNFSSNQGVDAGYLIPTVTHSLRADGFDASEDGTGRGTPLVPIAFDCKASGQNGFGVGEIASTMRSMGHSGSHQNGGGHQAVAFAQNQRDEVRTMDVAGALAAEPGAKQQKYAHVGMQVRRLTPRECERLQGFPDDYTLIPIKKRNPLAEMKELADFAERTGQPIIKWSADGPRYKALGNSMAVPCMAWIGRRIEAAHYV